MVNELYIQRKFIGRLRKLAVLPVEVNGVLLYLPVDDKDIVVASQILGGGTSSVETTHDPQRLQVVNMFLEKKKRYGYVEFHVHPEAIAPRGSHLARNLSGGDIQTILDNNKDNQSYRHLLVTPELMQLYGLNNGKVVPQEHKVMDDIEFHEELESRVGNRISELAASMGIELELIKIKVR